MHLDPWKAYSLPGILFNYHYKLAVMEQRQQHFLVVTYPVQGNINPALHLAKRLTRTTGSRVTFSTAISGHRRMFPCLARPNEEVEDGLLSCIPFSDGYDDFFKAISEVSDYMSKVKLVGSRSLATLVDDLAARGRPVSCILYTILLSWVVDVARDHGVRSALYWIQPATVFASYYHYFHDSNELITSHSHDPSFAVNFPGLPPLQIGDLPSLFTIAKSDDSILAAFREMFETLDREEKISKPRILMNTFDALEKDAIKTADSMELIAIGPVVPFLLLDGKDSEGTVSDGGLYQPDSKGYLEWLDSKAERSVVFVSFGSISVLKKQQLEEIFWGLKANGRPYLWVVRKEYRGELGVELEDGEEGMVVEWCFQVQVLSHPSVGCFVTHCGWNSSLEGMVCGVPTVGVPLFMDQGINARLAEFWGTGVRAELIKEGVLERRELRRCLEVVMGKGERGEEIRRRAKMWRETAREAVREGGSSDRNLKNFVEDIASGK